MDDPTQLGLPPQNPLLGTPAGPGYGVMPPNPLMQQAMQAPPPPQMPPPVATKEQVHDAIAKNTLSIQAMAKLLGKGSFTNKDVVNTLADLVSSGSVPAKQAAAEIANMPDDPQTLRLWVMNHYMQTVETGKRALDFAHMKGYGAP